MLLVVGAGLTVLAWLATVSLARPPDVIVVSRSPLLDRPAPSFALPALDAGTVRLEDYRGRPLVINFWASYCIPCAEEFRLLRAARERYASEGLEVLGIIHDDGPAAARRFAQAHGAQWPLLLDPDNEAWRTYHGVLLPITYYVDRQGIVRAVSYGAPPEGTLEGQLAKILAD
ncbi:MAG: TlpA family protein disulfide reductase [Chloroflexota bacterium]|nr:TlpA family protein disulfide reductase [Chloroflexota bacterium]